MFLAGDGVFDGLYIGLGNTRNPNSRTPFLAIDIEGDGGEERLNQIGANVREDLPVTPAMLTAESDQRVALLLAGLADNVRRTPRPSCIGPGHQ
jgi:hypothetical protein